MSVLLLTMGPQLGITADLPVVAVGGAGVIRFRAIGAAGPVKWTLVDSNLPAEWDSALNPDGNAVTLTTSDAETPGTFSVTVRAVDSARIPVVRSFDVRVMALPLTISGAFPEWTVGQPVAGALTISGGVPPYSGMSVASGALPDGVSLSIVGNQIVASGSPTVAGPWSATVQISDSLSTPASNVASGDVTEWVDPYWEHVVALLHFDGPDGSTTFTDATGRAWTPTNCELDTAETLIDGAAGLFPGPGTPGYLGTSKTGLAVSSNDFCIEATIKPTAMPASGRVATIVSTGRLAAPDYYGIRFFFEPDGKLRCYISYNGTSIGIDLLSSAGIISVGTRSRVALARVGSTVRIFHEGVIVASAAISGSIYMPSADMAYIARAVDRDSTTSLQGIYQGRMDEFRWTIGVGRYTANYTPLDRAFPDQ